ncbi:TetR/AcrR family transcriptional regulator [Paenibacillus lignilyticus]|uniref:TetR/AcrR family transcriptional regulator n=1 Tax=Paenibacillus lignilyticus TaxID=1172615 RepID=A0ABS5CG98_9BACL|nr:TetR/AcrR family transcriptional regulator [Paenibacillus lignilyticus]MBP3964868.1 TetR/AcrR family transcriptional regulator [Paenibacillus lignilyticus]
MTANRLKQAALTLFADSGYEGVSLSEIAKSVGIKTPSIYAHFDSKEQLFIELLEDAIREEREKLLLLLQGMEDHPPIERLYAVFLFYTDLDQITKGQSFLKRTMLVPPRHLESRLSQYFTTYEEEVTVHVSELLRGSTNGGTLGEERAERLLALFYALIDGLLVEHKLYDSALYRKRQEQLWSWLREALRPGTA